MVKMKAGTGPFKNIMAKGKKYDGNDGHAKEIIADQGTHCPQYLAL